MIVIYLAAVIAINYHNVSMVSVSVLLAHRQQTKVPIFIMQLGHIE